MASQLLELRVPPELAQALRRIRAAGFADSDDDAARIAIAAMASWIGGSANGTAVEDSEPDRVIDDHPANSVERALEIVRSERCTCRTNTGRHQLLLALLDILAKKGRASYAEILTEARRLAEKYNRDHGL